MFELAAIVILYNPHINIYENINSYINQISKLYVIDNSEIINIPLIEKIRLFNNVEYVCNNSNLGVAAALNIAANKAINEGFKYLLSMDQDSSFSDEFVYKMLKELNRNERIGILSPFIIHHINPKKPKDEGTEEIMVAMTSGSIVRLSAYKEIGEFLDKLFIDYVDHEYCLRLTSAGYKVVQLNSVFLYHKLGEIKQKKLFFKKIFPTNHAPLRLYYRTRNRFYVQKKFKKLFYEYVKQDRVIFLKEIIKIIFYENEKLKKLKMIILGYCDYRKNIFGKYKRNI